MTPSDFKNGLNKKAQQFSPEMAGLMGMIPGVGTNVASAYTNFHNPDKFTYGGTAMDTGAGVLGQLGGAALGGLGAGYLARNAELPNKRVAVLLSALAGASAGGGLAALMRAQSRMEQAPLNKHERKKRDENRTTKALALGLINTPGMQAGMRAYDKSITRPEVGLKSITANLPFLFMPPAIAAPANMATNYFSTQRALEKAASLEKRALAGCPICALTGDVQNHLQHATPETKAWFEGVMEKRKGYQKWGELAGIKDRITGHRASEGVINKLKARLNLSEVPVEESYRFPGPNAFFAPLHSQRGKGVEQMLSNEMPEMVRRLQSRGIDMNKLDRIVVTDPVLRTPGVLAHELGHAATDKQGGFWKFLQDRQHYATKATNPISGLSIALGALPGVMKGKSGLAAAGGAIGGGIGSVLSALPMYLSEAEAWKKGEGAITDLPSRLLAAKEKEKLWGLGSYKDLMLDPARAVGGAVLGGIAGSASAGLRHLI